MKDDDVEKRRKSFKLVKGFKNLKRAAEQSKWTVGMITTQAYCRALLRLKILDERMFRVQVGDRMFEITTKSWECGPEFPAG